MNSKTLSTTILLLASASATYAQTYPVVWSELINTTVTAGNTLTKTSGTTAVWNASAASYNLLPGGSNGYLQFTYATNTLYYMVSLSRENSEPSHVGSDYSLYVQGANLHIYEGAANRGSFGTLVNGDILKIERQGLAINYYKNTTVIRTVAITAAIASWHMRVDAALYQINTVVPAVITTFDRVITPRASFTFPSLANNDGGISLAPEGGDAPYTYLWSSSETTSSISGKPRGTYSVTVTDASSRTAAATYYLGYPETWTNMDNVNINSDGSLTRTLPSGGWGSGASSVNVIPVNTDGYVEFTVNDPSATYVIGLSDFDPDNTLNTVDFGIMVDYLGGVFTYRIGSPTAFGSIKKGDVFRVGREGLFFRAYRNGSLLTSYAALQTYPLVADVSVANNYGPTPVVTTSFDKQLRFKPTFTFPTASNNDGSIALNVQGAYTPSTVSWTPGGETTYTITGKSRGPYTATVNDAAPHSLARTYNLGFPITWTDLQNTQVNGDNTVTQIGSVAAWLTGAISSNVLPGSTDGWVEFVMPRTGVNAMMGLARINSAPHYNSIDYAFYLNAGNSLNIYELGVARGAFGYLSEGDVLRISREGSNIKYYLNGNVLRTIATTPTYALLVDISLNSVSLPTPIFTSSFGRSAQTFYSRADGNWNVPATWSLTEGGPAAPSYPAPGDVAHVKGFNVTITTGIYTSDINITVINDITCLKVDGAQGKLNVKGLVNVNGLNNPNAAKALIVQNDAKIDVQNP